MLKTILASASLAVVALASAPASATLQLSIDVNGTVVSCADGAACDQSSGANNLLVINETVGGATVQITLAQSTFGAVNSLQLSSSNITNNTGGLLNISLFASDTNFDSPVTHINNSGSLTFNSAVGSPASSLSFYASALNIQGANPINTPGTLLEQVFGTPLTDPDSFAGSNFATFIANNPFSMTESASLNLNGGSSITGFSQAMTSGVPETKTWAMFGLGIIAIAAMKLKRSRRGRLATV